MSAGLYPNDVMLPLRTCQAIHRQNGEQLKREMLARFLQSSLIWCSLRVRTSHQPAELPPRLMRLYNTLVFYLERMIYKCSIKNTKTSRIFI